MDGMAHRPDRRKGALEVICGSMFSGKTEELIRRLRRADIARQQVAVFKPVLDKRYDESSIVSHDDSKLGSTAVKSAAEIIRLAGEATVVGVDEAQFFDDGLPQVCTQLANEGRRVIAAGLDLDYLGKPFGPMPVLLALADFVTKVHAVCMHCGDLAHHSYRITDDKPLVLVGEKESYIALCRACYNQAGTQAAGHS